ncbi:hypothetical protein [Mycobacteroides abscessus]|uniref:hypothetical protein n=1 Tax=Mycobacteroides abscessus TaxID=36809 RepID=UPI0009416772|nr:hypothetical protein [Mycobacteroides abscessus]MBN7571230.1 hypothetical protein [Mycobacteroides abscessus subsp. abscessus]
MTEDVAAAYQTLTDWMNDHRSRGVFINADFAPAEEAEQWVEELVVGMVAAMADAGEVVSHGRIRTTSDRVVVELDGADFMARDIDGDGSKPQESVERLLARFARIAADRGCAQRWFYWYDGDPVGMAYFVTSAELKTLAGVDVRELGTAEQWYEAQPD